jgi:predicted nucleotidyltransferase
MEFGLPPATIHKIRNVFSGFPAIERAVIYGSRAKGSYKTGSDIDLTLFGEKLTFDILADVLDTLDELLLPYTFDISLYAKIDNPALREHIDRVGKIFYEKESVGENNAGPVAIDPVEAGLKPASTGEMPNGDAMSLPEGWEIKKLGEVCEIVNGGTPKTGVEEYWNGKHLWITPAEMGKRQSPYVEVTARKLSDSGLKNSSAQLLPTNSVILSSRAPIGHLVINTKPMATNQGCKGLVPSPKIDYKYLYHFLFSNVDLLNALGGKCHRSCRLIMR